MKLYKEVDASKELPKMGKHYFIIDDYGTCDIAFYNAHGHFEVWGGSHSDVKYWLKPISLSDLITEEEIEKICMGNTSPGLEDGCTEWWKQVKRNRKVAKAIINKLTGK